TGGCQEAQARDAREKEIRTTSDGGERGKPGDPLSNRALRDRHVERAVLRPDERIVLVAELFEVGVVGPDVHHELELTHQAGASHERGNASIGPVIGRILWQQRTVGAAAPDELMSLETLAR